MAYGLRVPDVVGIFVDTELGGANAAAPAITITELTGEQRSIELRGRALPHGPVAWGGTMRTKETWYQGNPVANQQVLGPELDPTTLEGKWKDRFMFGAEVGDEVQILVNGSGDEIRSAEAAVALFNDIRRSGNKLRVIWGPEVREGILVAFEAMYDRRQDIGWRMEFNWSSQGETERRAIAEPVGGDELLGSMNSLDDILGFSPEDSAKQFNAQLLDTVESVRESTGEVFGALRAINTVAAVPQSVIGAVSSAVASIRLELTEEIARLTENSIFGSEGATTSTRAASVMSAESYRRTTARRAADVRENSLEIDRQVQESATPREIQIVTVPQDSSLYTLSNKFYGTPDFAGFLARKNGLASAVAPAGFQLLVPPKPPVEAEFIGC